MTRLCVLLVAVFLAIALVPVTNQLLNKDQPFDYFGFVASFALVLAILVLFLVCRKRRAKLVLAVYALHLTYVTLEVVVTAYKASQPVMEQYYIWELPRNIAYDPIMGYKRLSVSARAARIVNGKVQYNGVNKGNNMGFTGAHDFYPKRKGAERRILVLGDSFTGMKMYDQLWPDHVEQLAKIQRKEWELQNLSMGGYGIANWVSLLENKVLKEGWELDEVVLAVFEGDDLERRFILGDHLSERPFLAQLDTWTLPDPSKDDYSDLEYGCVWWYADSNTVQLFLNSEEYNLMLEGRLPPWHKRSCLGLKRLFLYSAMVRTLRRLCSVTWQWRAIPKHTDGSSALVADVVAYEDEKHQRMIDRFVAALRQLGKPVKVVYIPSKYQWFDEGPHSGFRKVKRLAAVLDAKFFDGREAFSDLTADQRKECFHEFDIHWNQRGSNLFGKFVFERVLVER